MKNTEVLNNDWYLFSQEQFLNFILADARYDLKHEVSGLIPFSSSTKNAIVKGIPLCYQRAQLLYLPLFSFLSFDQEVRIKTYLLLK